MSARKTDAIEGNHSSAKSHEKQRRADSPVEEALIDLHYPRPTSLSAIIEDVAGWSDYNFVMEPGLNKSIQIFAPRKLKKPDAFTLFVASLETVGLRAVVMDSKVVKIVAHGLGKVAV